MKVRFTNKYGSWGGSETGKGKFAIRMIAEWRKMGIDVTENVSAEVDIDLQMQKFSYEPRHTKRVVLRCGPVEYDTNTEYAEKNKAIRHAQKRSDGIVYQSQFAEAAHRSMVWDHKRPSRIIHNGADPTFYGALEPWPSPFPVNFVASTREWVWEKRLVDVIEAFRRAAIPDSCLWILGQTWDTPKRFPGFQKDISRRAQGDTIRFMGLQPDKVVGRFLRMADCLLHAVYIDACPNAVVEALCAGCPVLATNVGGQTELTDHIVQCDPPWDYQARDRRKPPLLDTGAFASKMPEMIDNTVQQDVQDMHIATAAKRYIDFFQELLA